MSLGTVSEVWDILREHIDLNDRLEAAESLITFLMENNYEVDDIKNEFKDKDITKALKEYAAQHFQEEDYEEYEEDTDEDDWD